MTFCSTHINNLETRFTRPIRNVDSENPQTEQTHWIFSCKGRPLGRAALETLESKELHQAHRYVLMHHEDIEIYRQ